MTASSKFRPDTNPCVLTANRLRDGRVVWFAADGRFSDDIADAALVPPAAAEAMLAQAKRAEARQEVVGVYAVEIAAAPGEPKPLRLRERLRLAGPSVMAAPAAPRLAS